MRGWKTDTTRTVLISILLIYGIIIILILFFANQMLLDISAGRRISNFIIIPVAIILPLTMVITIAINIRRLIKEHQTSQPGVRFKTRLILFFSVIALLSALPQGVLSINFINSSMNTWFSSNIGEAIDGGLSIALKYSDDKLDNLRDFTGNPVAIGILKNFSYPEQIWLGISGANPEIDGIQIFKDDGTELYFKGPPEARLEPLPEYSPGILPRQDIGRTSILRSLARVTEKGEAYSVIFSILLPESFSENAGLLTESRETFLQLSRYKTQFKVALVIFYSIFAIPIILLLIQVSFLMSEEIISPIVHLEKATKKVAEGDFSVRILGKPRDELAVLVNSFNRMVFELEKTRVKTIQTEKVSAWQEIAQRMAHEIRNPLTPIKLSAQRILRKYKNDPSAFDRILEPAVNSIIQEVNSLDTMLSEFRDFARHPDPAATELPLREMIREVLDSYGRSRPDVEIQINDIPEEMIVFADRNQMKQVFSNLLKNAYESIRGAGQIVFRADLVRKGNLKYCRTQIQDNGSGIDEEYHNKVFHPYFTTKTEGTGLGLPIVERIISDHNGQIWFETRKNVGTTFFIDLPVERNI